MYLERIYRHSTVQVRITYRHFSLYISFAEINKPPPYLTLSSKSRPLPLKRAWNKWAPGGGGEGGLKGGRLLTTTFLLFQVSNHRILETLMSTDKRLCQFFSMERVFKSFRVTTLFGRSRDMYRKSLKLKRQFWLLKTVSVFKDHHGAKRDISISLKFLLLRKLWHHKYAYSYTLYCSFSILCNNSNCLRQIIVRKIGTLPLVLRV